MRLYEEREYYQAMEEFRASFDLGRGGVWRFPTGREFRGGANAFASVARTGEKRQFAGDC